MLECSWPQKVIVHNSSADSTCKISELQIFKSVFLVAGMICQMSSAYDCASLQSNRENDKSNSRHAGVYEFWPNVTARRRTHVFLDSTDFLFLGPINVCALCSGNILTAFF